MERPQLWAFAGPNGAGKSTLADRYARGRMPIVNPDNIARALPRAPSGGLDEREAGKRAVVERTRRLADGETFAFETTLSGNTELKLMRDAWAAGYKINLVYVGLADAGYSAARVSERVAAGGHDVSREDTDRRYPRTMANLPLAMATADRSFVFDNTGRRHRLVLIQEAGHTRFEATAFPAWAARALPADLRLERGQGR